MTQDALELPGVDPREELADVGVGGEAHPTSASVIGIDLSLTGTGMADGTRTWLLASKPLSDDDDLAQRRERLSRLARRICQHIPVDVDLVLIEGPSHNSKFGHPHDRSGLWWLVVNSLIAAGVPTMEVPPPSLKKYATGNGGAKKELVIDATARRYPAVETGAVSDRCDAHWLAAIGLDHLTGIHAVPATHRVALDKLRWPARRPA